MENGQTVVDNTDKNGFWMANLFALRTPYPEKMMADPDPVA